MALHPLTLDEFSVLFGDGEEENDLPAFSHPADPSSRLLLFAPLREALATATDYAEPLPEVIAARHWIEHDLFDTASGLCQVSSLGSLSRHVFDRWFAQEVRRWRATASVVPPCVEHAEMRRKCLACLRAFCAYWSLMSCDGVPIPLWVATQELRWADLGVASNLHIRTRSEWDDAALATFRDRRWTCQHLLPGYHVGRPNRVNCTEVSTVLTPRATERHTANAVARRTTAPLEVSFA